MENIEFRAYNKKNKKLLLVSVIDFGYQVIGVDNGLEDGYNYIPFKNIILDRYIGIKDENKNKIYENDIVKNKLSIKFLIIYDNLNHCWCGVQIGNKNKSYYGGIRGQDLRLLTIIGNKHKKYGGLR